jgi:glycerate kinase
MKKCIVISDSFKGTLSSLEICKLARQSIAKIFPDCEVVDLPVADGGEGTVECFVQAIQAQPVTVEVSGPYGEKVQAIYCRSGRRAIIEMASAAGLPMVEGRLDPEKTTTYGVGQLIAHAVGCGCKEILLGLGGSCTNDGGCGCAAALGTKFFRADGSPFVPVGGTLDQIARVDVSETKKLLEGVQVTIMCDVENPLCGPTGAAYVFAPQKGADQDMVKRLDAGLRAMDRAICQSLGLQVGGVPGAGAAGGMGAGCIAFLGAELKSGIEAVLDALDFGRRLRGADLVITGEGRIDSQSVHGKVISGIAKRTKPKNVPLIAIVGGIGPGAEEAYDLGVTAIFGTDRPAMDFRQYPEPAAVYYQRTLEDILRLIKGIPK